MPKTSNAKRPQPLISTLRLASIRKLLEDRRGAGFAGATLVAEEERCFRGALPSILELKGRAIGPGLALSWAELWTPALLADCAATWVEELAAQHLARPRHLKADALGRLLELSDEERTRLRIRTIGAIDNSKRKRAAERKAKDREYQKRKRLENGATPRDRSLSASKPWEAAGVSRATWYRQQKTLETAGSASHETVSSAIKEPSVLIPTPSDEFVSRREGVPLKGTPASRASLSIVDELRSLPLPAIAAMELLRSRSFMEPAR
ncbi:hypothetical protein [Microvirga sp. CF3016]|uniref:hypothetical protein n=1 Tax=Microvirga sp. CF3016 TaxID=3110181 RepID=UPI002E78D49F|nr:hypothetical protein [Microvirga sp. CF3016]MEE1611129.1 hypothetical protein [Microvirga sp. CF3016]